jgi:hypothetical protein
VKSLGAHEFAGRADQVVEDNIIAAVEVLHHLIGWS